LSNVFLTSPFSSKVPHYKGSSPQTTTSFVCFLRVSFQDVTMTTILRGCINHKVPRYVTS
jgi:hypothetical protein